MLAKHGRFGAAVALACLAAAFAPACGGTSAQGDETTDPDPTGQSGEGPAGNATVGGEGGTGGSSTGVTGGEPGTQGGAGSDGCVPDERVCDGSSVRVCDGQGNSTIEETCAASEVCSEAECVPISCVPGSRFCQSGAIRVCDESGAASELLEECGKSEFCLELEGSAECSDTACAAGEPMCSGNIASRCRADGSGAEPGGQDCAKQGLLCQEGQCAAPTCTAGEKLCEHDDVYLCVGNGASSVLFTDCGANEICEPNLLSCRARICEPGKLGCDATRVVACNALGTGWDQSGKDCDATGQLCSAGTCKTQVCIPGSTFCKGGDVHQCDAIGTGSSLSQTCTPAYYHCASYPYQPNTATCTYNNCTPGVAMCNGSVATKCAADGTGPEPGGQDCAPDGICDAYGAKTCKPKVCEPNTSFCKDGDLAQCQDGSYSYVYSTCPDDAPCGVKGNGIACVPYKCWPGLKACIDNQLGTCAADGMSLTTVKQDCAATEDICVSTSACGKTALDTVGSAEELASVSDGRLFGDVIQVESNRQLTQIESNLVLAGSRSLRWLVYELVDGYYTPRFDTVVSSQAGSGYYSSGAISYTLKAGKTYLLGAAVTGGGVAPYYDQLPWQPEVSFGRVAGSITEAYSSTVYNNLNNTSVFSLRFTTQLP